MAKQRIVENIKVLPEQYKRQQLDESAQIHVNEANGDQSYKALAVYTFPISRPDKKNLNGRIYTSKLWEKVIKEKQAEGCYGLMDHPEEDGSTKDYWCVWRNLRFSDDKKLIIADAYLFGMWGKQVLEALEAGGSIGLSSSGWGEFNDDNTTLNEETYLLERVADHVLSPAYEVFGHQEDLVTTGESVNKTTESISLENSPKNNKETAMENTKPASSPSLEEKSLLLNIKSMFKETKQITNVFERQEGYISLLSYFDEKLAKSGSDLMKEIENARKEDEELIHNNVAQYDSVKEKADSLEEKTAKLENDLTEANNKLTETEAALKEAEEKLAVVTKENAGLEAKFSESCEMLDSFKAYASKQKEITRTLEAEKNGMVTAKEYKEAIVYSQSLEEELRKVKAELAEAKSCHKEDDDEDDTEKDDDKDNAGDNDKDDTDDLDKMNDKKKESFVNESIEEYYNDLICRNPKVSKIKPDIMKCRTLVEAQTTYLRLKGLVDESPMSYYDNANRAVSKMATKEEKAVKRSALRKGWV